MPFPSTVFEVGVVLLLLLPGLVFAVVRRHLKGFQYDDLAIDTRIAQALVVCAVLDAAYFLVGWRHLAGLVDLSSDPPRILEPAGAALAILIGCVLVPGALASAIYAPWRPRWRGDGEYGLLFRLERTVRSSGIPTAWDKAASGPDHRLVRVRRTDGTWVGGLWAEGSFVSTYPQPRDLYLSLQCRLSDEGEFLSEVEDSEGVWLRINDDDVVEFVTPIYTDAQKAEMAAEREKRRRLPIWKPRPKDKR